MAGTRRKTASDMLEPLMDEQMRRQAMRIAEAVLFASQEPVSEDLFAEKLGSDIDVRALLEALAEEYATRGVNLRRIAGKWQFRTADDLGDYLRGEKIDRRNLTRAQLDT